MNPIKVIVGGRVTQGMSLFCKFFDLHVQVRHNLMFPHIAIYTDLGFGLIWLGPSTSSQAICTFATNIYYKDYL